MDDFTIRIFADNGGLPDVNPLTSLSIGNSATRTDTGQNTDIGFDLYQYDLDIAPISLTPNTTYWLSIVNNTDTDWSWQTSTVINGLAFRSIDGESWSFFSNGDLAFNLTGTAIPEPLTMLGVGTAVGFGTFFKRKIAKK